MFLSEGEFLKRTSIDEKFLKETSIGKKLSTLAGIKKMMGQMSMCQKCCKEFLTDKDSSDLFLGYLTRKEHEEYRRYAKKAETLHSRGYLIVDRGDFCECNFPLRHFLRVCYNNRSKIETLPNGPNKKDRSRKRAWMPFRENWGEGGVVEFKKTHRQKLANQMTKIISPDIGFGRRAMQNRYNLLPTAKWKPSEDEKNWQAFSIKGEAALWRGLGLQHYQSPHADAHAGAFNIIETLTNNYGIKVWAGSHFLPFWDKNKRPTVHGIGSNIYINVGQIIVFHSNLIHCGGMSCQIPDNFSKVKANLIKLNKEYAESIKWFGKGDAAQKCTVTDMSLHYTVDTAIGQMSEGDFDTGAIEIFAPTWLPNANSKYSETLRNGLEKYRHMKMPGTANEREPCGSIILDVDKVLDRYLNGCVCESSTRKSSRLARR